MGLFLFGGEGVLKHPLVRPKRTAFWDAPVPGAVPRRARDGWIALRRDRHNPTLKKWPDAPIPVILVGRFLFGGEGVLSRPLVLPSAFMAGLFSAVAKSRQGQLVPLLRLRFPITVRKVETPRAEMNCCSAMAFSKQVPSPCSGLFISLNGLNSRRAYCHRSSDSRAIIQVAPGRARQLRPCQIR